MMAHEKVEYKSLDNELKRGISHFETTYPSVAE